MTTRYLTALPLILALVAALPAQATDNSIGKEMRNAAAVAIRCFSEISIGT